MDDVEEIEPEKIVRCKNCEHEITKPASAINPHEHTFRNPLGVTYHVACYRDAPGAISYGNPTTLASWFENYAWTLAFCGQCKCHLGWWFHGTDLFVALIVPLILRD
jgi:hypothetical protein